MIAMPDKKHEAKPANKKPQMASKPSTELKKSATTKKTTKR
jgi:hypothetical protein